MSTAPIISHQLKVKSTLLTRLSSPPPRRSTAPICMEDTWGTLTGGPRSRLRRSPRRSPCDGMTWGCSRFVVAVVPTGLSPASVLRVGGTRGREERCWVPSACSFGLPAWGNAARGGQQAGGSSKIILAADLTTALYEVLCSGKWSFNTCFEHRDLPCFVHDLQFREGNFQV